MPTRRHLYSQIIEIELLMTSTTIANSPSTTTPANTSLPSGGQVQQIAFVDQRTDSQELLFNFPVEFSRHAVVDQSNSVAVSPSTGLTVLSIPHQEDSQSASDASRSASVEADSFILQAKTWTEATLPEGAPASLMMTLQGTQIFWTRGRLAIIAVPNRIETIKKSLTEVSFYEAELSDIERVLSEAWPGLESDTPLAFEAEDKTSGKQKKMRQRFEQVFQLRARLARVSPHVHCPHLHPPTLASQVSERLRERTHMLHRYEQLDEQLCAFERVYEMAGQRGSDHALARTGHVLEWVIIILLSLQTLLWFFELLTSFGESAAQ